MGRNVLIHYGTKGMKWGVNRFRNPDGSLNAAGIRRYMENNSGSNRSGYSTSNPTGKPLAGAGRYSQNITPVDRVRNGMIRKDKWAAADAAVRANPSSQNRNAEKSLYPIGFQANKPDNKKYTTGYDNVNENGYRAKYQAGQYDNKRPGVDYKLNHLIPVKGYEDYKRTWDEQRDVRDRLDRYKYRDRPDVQQRTAKAQEIAKARQSGKNVRNAISGAVGAAKNTYNSASNAAKNAYNDASTWAGNAAKDVSSAAKNAYNDASKWAGNAAKDVSSAAKNAYNSASNAAKDAIYGKQTTISRGALEGNSYRQGGAINSAKNAYNSASNAAKNAYNDASTWAGNAAKDVSSAAKNAYNDASEWAGNAAKDVSEAVSGAAGKVSEVANDSFNKAKGFLNGLFGGKKKKKK